MTETSCLNESSSAFAKQTASLAEQEEQLSHLLNRWSKLADEFQQIARNCDAKKIDPEPPMRQLQALIEHDLAMKEVEQALKWALSKNFFRENQFCLSVLENP